MTWMSRMARMAQIARQRTQASTCLLLNTLSSRDELPCLPPFFFNKMWVLENKTYILVLVRQAFHHWLGHFSSLFIKANRFICCTSRLRYRISEKWWCRDGVWAQQSRALADLQRTPIWFPEFISASSVLSIISSSGIPWPSSDLHGDLHTKHTYTETNTHT